MEKVCCVCHRIKRQQGWVKEEKGLEVSRFSHGYCPRCYQEAMRKMHEYGARQQPSLAMG